MAKLTKRQQAFQGKVEAGKVYPAVEATLPFSSVLIRASLIRLFAVQSSCPKALVRLFA